MDAQGPDAPGLLEHLRDEGASYDAVAFVTYLYAHDRRRHRRWSPTARCWCPTLHDEPPARLSVFRPVFDAARALIFSTPEERELARERFGVGDERARVAGWGLDQPPPADPARLRSRSASTRPYVLCVGRIDLVEGRRRPGRAPRPLPARPSPDGADLVLIGGGDAALPEHPWLHRARVRRRAGQARRVRGRAGPGGARRPTRASRSCSSRRGATGGRRSPNAASPVLVGQSRRSGGGLWYRDADEYLVMLDLLVRNAPLAHAIGRQGAAWVAAECSWDRVRRVWLDALAAASPAGSAR